MRFGFAGAPATASRPSGGASADANNPVAPFALLRRLGASTSLPDPLVAITLAALLVGTILRMRLGAGLPLWLDETFTGAFATQNSLGEVVYQILQDINAPLYYLVAYGGAKIFGISNEALRLPALVFGCVAPLLCLIPARGIDRKTRLLWCALIALWGPSLTASQEARCYTLLLGLSIMSTLFFVRLLDRPGTRNAALWALFGGLAIVTHYYALVLVALQGLAYLAVHRGRALRTWPAALVFAPVFAWLLVHAQRIAELARPDVAWYWTVDFDMFLAMLGFVAGSFTVFNGLVALFPLALFWRLRMRNESQDAGPIALSARIAVAVAAVSVALVIAVAIWRPLLVPRYLVPFVPGILLGLAFAPRILGPAGRAVACVLVALFAVGAISMPRYGKPYNFEIASEVLLDAGAKHVVFYWDHPANQVEDPSQLEIVGGFFFKRHGAAVDVTPFKLSEAVDPNPRLLALAQRPDSAILWIYDTNVAGTHATSFPPALSALDPSLRCRDFGHGAIKILACARSAG